MVKPEYGNKVPVNVRQRYLDEIYTSCLKLYTQDQEAHNRAIKEELDVYNRSSTRNVYLNVAVNTVKRLRSELDSGPSTTNSASTSKTITRRPSKTVSHDAIIAGSKALKVPYTLNLHGGHIKVNMDTVTDAELYMFLKRYILIEDELTLHGFPRIDPTGAPGAPKIQKNLLASSVKPKHANERLCRRCGKEFIVGSHGSYPPSQCRYHWGKTHKSKACGIWVSVYRCCNGDLNSPTCSVAEYHVHEQNKVDPPYGFVATIPCSPKSDENYGVFALDCEMVYTLSGIELARVTVINSQCQPVYETLVKPKEKILDYNTRFSGITEKDMQGVSTTIRDVQASLLATFSAQTILIGHSLESDLIALKIIHSTVVDTSVVFPHRLGLPYKMGLKKLAGDLIQKIIQEDVGGHDSLEDAAACMELMRYKVKEDIRMKKLRSR